MATTVYERENCVGEFGFYGSRARSITKSGCSCKLVGKKGARFSLVYYLESFHSITFRIIMPFRKLMPPSTLTASFAL